MTDSQIPNQPGAESNPGADGTTNEIPAVELNAAWPPPAAQTAWSTPFEEKPTYKKRGALLAAGAALVTMLGVTGVAMAANSADDDDETAAAAATPSASTEAKGNPSDDRPGNRGRHGGLGHGLGHGLGKTVLHGEAVVKTADGYATMLNQLGEVTAVSVTSITVKSEDGFSDTYAIPAATADDSADTDDDADDSVKPKKVRIDRDVAVGDTVRVVATQGSGDPVVVVLKERGADDAANTDDDADTDDDDDDASESAAPTPTPTS